MYVLTFMYIYIYMKDTYMAWNKNRRHLKDATNIVRANTAYIQVIQFD